MKQNAKAYLYARMSAGPRLHTTMVLSADAAATFKSNFVIFFTQIYILHLDLIPGRVDRKQMLYALHHYAPQF